MYNFTKIKAYPDGKVEFVYPDKTITLNKDGTAKELYGYFYGSNKLSDSSIKPIVDKLHHNF